MSQDAEFREDIVKFGAMLYQKGLAHGTAGNLSVRLDDNSILVTPTNSSLGYLDPSRISRVSTEGEPLEGDPPSKEVFFHLAMYGQRPEARAVVHLHSTHCVALSCLHHDDPSNVLPALTAYGIMRVGKLPLLPYYRPGNRALAEAVRHFARNHKSMLLANHGPIIAGATLADAIFSYEELEETAKLYFLTHHKNVDLLNDFDISELNSIFVS